MNFDALVAELAKRDIKLRRNGSELDLRGRQEMLDPAMLEELRMHKAGLLKVIGNGDEWWMSPSTIAPRLLPLPHLTQEQFERIAACVPGGAAKVPDLYPSAPLQPAHLCDLLL